jgi:hypothetical protein
MQNPVPNGDHSSGTYVVEVGGKVALESMSFTAALKAGFELRKQNADVPVKVCDKAKRA